MRYHLFVCSILSVQCNPPDLRRHHGGKSKCPSNKQWEGTRANEAGRYGVRGSKLQTEQGDRNKVPVGETGVGQGKETEVKWEERGRGGRQGKHVEWVRIGTVSQGSVCRELSASLSLLLCHRNLLLKSWLSITYVFYGRNASRTWQAPNRHQTESCSAAGILCFC